MLTPYRDNVKEVCSVSIWCEVVKRRSFWSGSFHQSDWMTVQGPVVEDWHIVITKSRFAFASKANCHATTRHTTNEVRRLGGSSALTVTSDGFCQVCLEVHFLIYRCWVFNAVRGKSLFGESCETRTLDKNTVLGALEGLWKAAVCFDMSVSACPHGTTLLSLDGFPWNLMFF